MTQAPCPVSACGPAPSPAPLLSVRDLRVRFGAKQVVHGVSLDIYPGEKLALVGESGSGKSVTALSLLRLVGDATVTGHAMWRMHDGRRGGVLPGGHPHATGTGAASASHPHPDRVCDLLTLPERRMQALRGDDIAMIFQEPMTALNPLMPIGRQISEVLRLKKALPPAEAMQAAVALLEQTGIPEPQRRANAFAHELSGGQRQRAMIAMALACQPRLLLADEPTTALDVALRGQMLELLEQLQRTTGMAVLLITHDLHLVRRFVGRTVVMQQGQVVESGPTAELFVAPRHPYTRRLLNSSPQRRLLPARSDAPPVVQTTGLRVDYPVALPGIRGWLRKGQFTAVHGADLCLRRGHTLGIVGESGSGKSTLAQAILGLLPSTGGLHICQQQWQQPATRNTPANQALRRQVQVVFQDPFSALSPRMTVQDIVGEGLRVHHRRLHCDCGPGSRGTRAAASFGTATYDMTRDEAAHLRAQVLQALRDVGLTEEAFPGLLQRYPHEFSGGQRQRLAIARALILRPEVLVLDEPTSALDVTIQQQVLHLLQDLQRERGLSYLLITHDMDVIRAMAHDVIVMQSGRIVESGPADTVLTHPQHPYTRQLVHHLSPGATAPEPYPLQPGP